MSEHAAATAHEGVANPKAYNRAKLGMWLFLGSEVMFFTGFLTAYIVLRTSNYIAQDQHLLNKPLAALNTAVLIISSLTMALAVGAIQRGNVAKLRQFLLLTILCAFGFMVIKYVEYSAKLGKTRDVELTTEFVEQSLEKMKQGKPPVLATPLTVDGDTVPAGPVSAEHLTGMLTDNADAEPLIKLTLSEPIGPSHSVFFGAYYTLTGFHGLHVVGGIIALFILFLRANKYSASSFAPVECTGLYWHFVDVVWIFLFPILYLI